MKTGTKKYLGDGVYAEVVWDGQTLLLTTENGIQATNRILLEPEVLGALEWFIEKMRKGDD